LSTRLVLKVLLPSPKADFPKADWIGALVALNRETTRAWAMFALIQRFQELKEAGSEEKNGYGP
jgi:hypothetical protein